jgi:hypothetical protein
MLMVNQKSSPDVTKMTPRAGGALDAVLGAIWGAGVG